MTTLQVLFACNKRPKDALWYHGRTAVVPIDSETGEAATIAKLHGEELYLFSSRRFEILKATAKRNLLADRYVGTVDSVVYTLLEGRKGQWRWHVNK